MLLFSEKTNEADVKCTNISRTNEMKISFEQLKKTKWMGWFTNDERAKWKKT